jgi:hypothetical protein
MNDPSFGSEPHGEEHAGSEAAAGVVPKEIEDVAVKRTTTAIFTDRTFKLTVSPERLGADGYHPDVGHESSMNTIGDDP